MTKDDILKLAAEIANYPVFSADDIPDIDLYMDQVTTLIDDKLSLQKRSEAEKMLTKTMINNYTKAKLLPPPVKKKYTKRHIERLVLIYWLKNVLSISDVSTLLSVIAKGADIDSAFLEYENTLAFLNERFTTSIEATLDNLGNANAPTDAARLALALLLDANMKKMMAERLIDTLHK